MSGHATNGINNKIITELYVQIGTLNLSDMLSILSLVLSFLREAAQHAEQVEAILLSDYRISQVQIDGLWTYVKRKDAKKGR